MCKNELFWGILLPLLPKRMVFGWSKGTICKIWTGEWKRQKRMWKHHHNLVGWKSKSWEQNEILKKKGNTGWFAWSQSLLSDKGSTATQLPQIWNTKLQHWSTEQNMMKLYEDSVGECMGVWRTWKSAPTKRYLRREHNAMANVQAKGHT